MGLEGGWMGAIVQNRYVFGNTIALPANYFPDVFLSITFCHKGIKFLWLHFHYMLLYNIVA
ncbi:MAG: hypothetical protein EAZ60_23235 [Oscillatoriales cyanobacterium]|nr:MAG: hypothetical protein EAZ60_23235 [Oscillatoriales cyanobacterium]